MKITEVRIAWRDDDDEMKAWASVTIEDLFVVRGLKVVEDREGQLAVTMPSQRKPDGTSADVFQVLTGDAWNTLEAAVIEAYLSGPGPTAAANEPARLPDGPPPLRRGYARPLPRPASDVWDDDGRGTGAPAWVSSR